MVAINILMTGWTAIVESISGIEHFVFIDDCYLLALESNVENLAAALTGTKFFDKLVGQKLNIDKSSGFATSRTAKKKLANAIPAFPIHDTFAVLVTFVKTNAKRITIDPKNTAQGVRAMLHDIEHLPISLRKKKKSMKAVSKFLYHPEVIPWPKATIDSMVNSVAKALWGNRPGWRNQELLFALCTNPIACHPHMSIATRVICNIVVRCKRDEGFFCLWSELCGRNKAIARGLVDAFLKACETLAIEFVRPHTFRCLGREISFFELSIAGLRRVCHFAAVQCLCRQASSSARKDLDRTGSGGVDHDVVTFLGPREPWRPASFDDSIVPGILTGACPTANRLYKSNLLDSAKCRFCDFSS